jgi:sulfate adenylyltransferase subunit 1
MDVLKIATAGSVDDGKSTLIGRLLYDSKSLTDDKIQGITESSKKKGFDYLDFSLATDGLTAEREQGITIDVAHIYFSTPRRSYIIADTPGHVEYTRNMVTGASTSQASIILVDARKGVIEQTYRHFFINNLLRIKEIIVAVNKMDLVDYSEDVFENIKAEFTALIAQSDFKEQQITFIPVSALRGENIVNKSEEMPWYHGKTILKHLDALDLDQFKESSQTRFSVQTSIRPKSDSYHDFRGFAGIVEGGGFKIGEQVTVLPSMTSSKIKGIHLFENSYDEVAEGSSATITLEDEVNITRGDLLVKSSEIPKTSKSIMAKICWMDSKPMVSGTKYVLQHNTNTMTVKVQEILNVISTDFSGTYGVDELKLNEIGNVQIQLSKPLFADSYEDNKANGKFIIIDCQTNQTSGVGFVN